MMKKVLVFLLICLSSTLMLAQTPPTSTHWQVYPGNTTPMSMSAVLVIDGQEVDADEGDPYDARFLEIGIFDQDGVCRGAKLPKLKNGHYRYSPAINIISGEGATESYTCKVWDHKNNCELEGLTYIPDTEDPLVVSPGHAYGSSSNLYQLTFATTTTGIELTINAYAINPEGGYYLISSPVGEVEPGDVTNMTEYAYDLYSFDLNGSDGLEWRNYKAGEFSALQPGWGYLYANSGDGESETVTLTFPGSAFTTADETYSVDLVYNADAEFPGKNLVGNPFNQPAYIDRDYYVMNEEGTNILTDAVGPDNAIAAKQGVFVEAIEDGETFTFYVNNPSGDKGEGMIVLNLTNGRSVIDRATVRFGEGRQLHKFQLRENSTKVYFTMDNEDYAVVRSANQGEMPVSFKAEKNGTYTLSLGSENADFAYLHLIDNLTGADQDLLANPSYSFEAKTTDYATRFRLVFATANDEDSFAFFSNGSFIINNEGNAIVQVVDVTGRIVKCESINGCASVNVNGAAGIYMIRLINGDNVKVQKVVVK